MARKSPVKTAEMVASGPDMDAHQKMLDEMHSALYSLSDKIRKPYNSSGDKLLPKELAPSETPEAKAARAHITAMHKAMKSMAKGE